MSGEGRRSYLLRVGEPCVIVPARIADLLERAAGLSALRVRVRGIDPEASAVLEDLRLAALQWRGSSTGTDDDRPQEQAPRSKWLATGEAADIAGVTREAIGKAIRSGRLPATRTGNRWVVDREDLQHYRAARADRG